MLNPSFQELNMLEKSEFIGKLIIAAQTDYFIECAEIVNQAQRQGLFKRMQPLVSGNIPEIIDLDSPIENGICTH